MACSLRWLFRACGLTEFPEGLCFHFNEIDSKYHHREEKDEIYNLRS